MEIAVQSRNIEVSDALRASIDEKMNKLSRFLEGMNRAEVRFQEQKNPRISEREVCEVTLHGHGHVVRAKAAAPDLFTALDRVTDKLQHRMEKLKGKLMVRSQARRANGNGSGAKSLTPSPDGLAAGLVDLSVHSGVDLLERIETDEPQIVKKKQFAITPMTTDEAVLQMDLLGHDFFLFTNEDTGNTAVVYRRSDEQIGLIDAG